MSRLSTPAESLQSRFPNKVIAISTFRDQQAVTLAAEGLLEAARFLKEDPDSAFDFLMDLTAVDYLKFGQFQDSQPTMPTPSPLPYFMKPKRLDETWARAVSDTEYRFDVVYHFFSSAHQHRLRLMIPLKMGALQVRSLTGLWKAADWFEREVWDLFGIVFEGHPNLKRILMYEGFEGHPLRKSYPYYKRQPLIGPQN